MTLLAEGERRSLLLYKHDPPDGGPCASESINA